MVRARLTKREALTDVVSEDPIRTSVIEGCFASLPFEGYVFHFFAEPLVDKTAICRLISTSPVVLIKIAPDHESMIFQTENSAYVLEFLEELPLEMIADLRGVV